MTREPAPEQPAPRAEPLRQDELELVQRVVDALEESRTEDAFDSVRMIRHQLRSLRMFAELLERYPSPLQDQFLYGKRRGLDTLVDRMVAADLATFPFRAPTQALVGRSMNMAQINFLRMIWHLTGSLEDEGAARHLREVAARRLRTAVHTRLVEEVLADIVTDASVDRQVRAQGVRSLAYLWGNRLTWRVNEFFPILDATWEARLRVRVVGGSLAGSSELVQLMTEGADEEFVDFFTSGGYGDLELEAFREFLFGTSSEELQRLSRRMADEGVTSIELDSRVDDAARDSGSILFEFFRSRLLQCSSRRVAGLPGPRHTAEGYVMVAWLQRQCAG
ncbi:MAG: hypothetical protein ACON4Z_00680 [Planctomycetota bacterium]